MAELLFTGMQRLKINTELSIKEVLSPGFRHYHEND
jgi:hypothetical protein